MARENLKEGVECPCCGLKTAVVKRQTNGKLYVFCRDGCNHQAFARTEQQNAAMAKKYSVPAAENVQGEIDLPKGKESGKWMI